MRGRRGLEIGFAWLFAIIVGAVILFLAIYWTTEFIDTSRDVSDSQIGAELQVLLEPLALGLEDGKMAKLQMPLRTRIFTTCKEIGTFGQQLVAVATQSGVGAQWQKPGVASPSYHQYFFHEVPAEGKEFVVLSKGFDLGFKVADVMTIWPAEEKYCWVNPPSDLEDELEALNPGNIETVVSAEACPVGSTSVCFTSSDCDVDVSVVSQSVTKDGETVFYDEGLIWAAIFSDADLYECQVRRLGRRGAELALLHVAKSELQTARGCSTNLEGSLMVLADSARGLSGSAGLAGLRIHSDDLKRRNDLLGCGLF